MLGYALVGTRDLERARAFFDLVFAELGMARLHDAGHMTYWGGGFDRGAVGVCLPLDRNSATAGNGTMLAIAAPSREAIDTAHTVALASGGVDEGRPGVRAGEGASAFYAAYFRDLDGNKFSLFRIGES
ncbi:MULTISPECIES: VOC family protein [unclassified Novosphingobium]|uniref:VOC family protein n=1 Tax=unclassified Novosphingobium TaxID=2644732 RepID=UPI000D31B555|nr:MULTISPECIES: VOC family protein [unclassified Novosphingobium]PTR12557.1 hypothetical protein C8K11_10210 [Novosphingobium sp. GV055]PUB06341.1 hypothetical protein C8K12_10210 [Novosphingobium sp. GV061]PUB22392.1 hypothetical protein C8K14_10210 [Novosphingobium sp. GV079]PUB44417.1 hypothetical protein C8K10_10210 [Novosphingobium sp. GV027]